MTRFTLRPVGWRPRLPPVDAATATPAQLAALEACPPAQRRSTYFLTLAHDPGSLGERGALFTTVMYAEGGLPFADREYATAIVSIVNGCVYCTSVHAKRFVDITGATEAMQAVLEGGTDADPRRAAIAEFAAAMTRDPTSADLAGLREEEMADLEILDLIHSVAMFANANRLMQSLGDSIVPPGAFLAGVPKGA